MAWIYRGTPYGDFFIQEELQNAEAIEREWDRLSAMPQGCSPMELTEEQKEGFGEGAYGEQCNPSRGQIVTVHGDTKAFLMEGTATNLLAWLSPFHGATPDDESRARERWQSPALVTTIVGPAEEMTVEYLKEIAEKV